MPEGEEKRLPAHEWVVVGVALMGIMLLTVLAVIGGNVDSDIAPFFYSGADEVTVRVEGAVKRPGLYTVAKGETIDHVLTLAEPLPSADLKKLKVDSVIGRSRRLVVKEKKKIAVTIEGAVENPGIIQVERGTRLSELRERLQFKEGARLDFFNKRRYLREGERLFVPEKIEK